MNEEESRRPRWTSPSRRPRWTSPAGWREQCQLDLWLSPSEMALVGLGLSPSKMTRVGLGKKPWEGNNWRTENKRVHGFIHSIHICIYPSIYAELQTLFRRKWENSLNCYFDVGIEYFDTDFGQTWFWDGILMEIMVNLWWNMMKIRCLNNWRTATSHLSKGFNLPLHLGNAQINAYFFVWIPFERVIPSIPHTGK